jgi:lambda repressor-like predicted transcriptional regulator
MIYGSRALKLLKKSICKNCKKRLPNWDDDVYTCWLRYLNGCDRTEIIRGTRFSLYVSPRRYFRYHPCYRKIARIRKLWFRPVKMYVNVSLKDHPWLLGIFYADGSKHDGSQLSFALSLNEDIIAKKIVKELKKILGKKSHIVTEMIGNMINVRTHSVELCDAFPNKNNKKELVDVWRLFNRAEKLNFIGGYIDGDGSCQFQDSINSIQLFSKRTSVLGLFKEFLTKYGYTSLNGSLMYISPKVGSIIKPFTLKQYIKKIYMGSVDIKKALTLLEYGISVRKISKIMRFDKKTILIGLRRTYDKKKIQVLINKNESKRLSEYHGKYDLKKAFKMLKKGYSLGSIARLFNVEFTHLKNILSKRYGKSVIKRYIKKYHYKNKAIFSMRKTL